MQPNVPAVELGAKAFPWWPDWRGQIAAIIGGGPSAKAAPVDLLKGRAKVIVINESFRLAPWADVLYSCDFLWWQLHKGKKDWPGLRLAHDAQACNEYGIHRMQVDSPSNNELELERPGHLGAGGNSGFQAINAAVQFGANRLILIGIDCHLPGAHHSPQLNHWHGKHPSPLSNPMQSNVNRWKKAIDGIAPTLKRLGIECVNCSATSALIAYPKMTIEQALVRFNL